MGGLYKKNDWKTHQFKWVKTGDNKTSFYLRVVFDVIRRTFQTSSTATTKSSKSNSSKTIDKDSKHIWQTMKKPSRLMHHGSLYRKDKEKLSKNKQQLVIGACFHGCMNIILKLRFCYIFHINWLLLEFYQSEQTKNGQTTFTNHFFLLLNPVHCVHSSKITQSKDYKRTRFLSDEK